MANRQKSNILVEQVISKFLDSPNVKVPPNSALLKLLNPTTQKPPNNANTHTKTAGQAARQRPERPKPNSPLVRDTTKKTLGKLLVLIAWILLVLNILAVAGSFGYGQKLPLSLRAEENTSSFLLQMGMVALGVIVLCWTSWLYLRKRPCETAAVQGLIIIALAVPLAFMIGGLSGDTAGIEELGRVILRSFPVRPTPVYRLVNAVVYSDDKPSAIFGDEIVHEGDTIRGINVVKIYKDGVELEKNGKR